ncbi:hypothetical protein D3C74_127620 [compost metagenome]
MISLVDLRALFLGISERNPIESGGGTWNRMGVRSKKDVFHDVFFIRGRRPFLYENN